MKFYGGDSLQRPYPLGTHRGVTGSFGKRPRFRCTHKLETRLGKATRAQQEHEMEALIPPPRISKASAPSAWPPTTRSLDRKLTTSSVEEKPRLQPLAAQATEQGCGTALRRG